MPNVPTTNLNALYANTAPGNVIQSAVIDPALQDLAQTINDNFALFQELKFALELPIPDQSIVTRHLRNLAVTNPKLAPLAVTADKIADGSITLAKLADLVVTAAKIANGTITEPKMANGSVSRRTIIPGSVGANEIDPTILNPISDATVNIRLNQIDGQLADVVNARKVFGLTGDGSDETSKFQTALNNSVGKKLFISKQVGSHYYIGPISIPSNTHLIFESGVQITGRPLLQDGYLNSERLINIFEVESVIIEGNGVKIILANYASYTQEWNHIFDINSCKDVFIYDVNANYSGGDGYYIGNTRSTLRNLCLNIQLIRCKAEYNRRQGLSIISVDGFYAYQCEFNHTTGTAPRCGIDIEPNFPTEVLKNIKFEDCRATGNSQDAFRIDLSKFTSDSPTVDIRIKDFHSLNNGFGFNQRRYTNGGKGKIHVTNFTAELSKYSGFYEIDCRKGISRILQDCWAVNSNDNGVSNTAYIYGGGAAYFMTNSDDADYGGTTFRNCVSIDNRSTVKVVNAFRTYSASVSAISEYQFEKCSASGHTSSTPYSFPVNLSNVSIIEDENKLRKVDYATNVSSGYTGVLSSHINSVITNKGNVSGTITLRLNKPQPLMILRFRNEEAGRPLRIDMMNYAILGYSVGQILNSSQQGDYIVIRGRDDNKYEVIQKIGDWTVV